MDGQSNTTAELISRLVDLGKSLRPNEPPSRAVRSELISAAKHLIDELLEPEDHIWQKTTNGMEISAIRTIQRLNVLQAIPADGTISLRDLSKAASVQDTLLDRYLRLLVGTGFLAQCSDGKYGHTRISCAYLGVAGDFFSAASHDIGVASHVRYHDFLDAHQDLPIEEQGDKGHVFAWALGFDENSTASDAIATRPDLLARCQRGLAMIDSKDEDVNGSYPFHELTRDEARVALVDVGGGAGQSLIPIIDTNPQLQDAKIVLQDQEEVIKLASANPCLPAKVVKMVHDFNTPQPVKNAKAYHMRFIMHDYPDDRCIEILTHIRGAMGPDSKVLIADMIVPDKVDEESIRCAALDLVLLHTGGKERTVAGFEKILSAAGLKLHKVWLQPNRMHQGIIEAILP